MLVVVAIGTSVLEPEGSEAARERAIRRATRAISALAADHQVVVIHGSGGQTARLATDQSVPAALHRLDVVDAAVGGIVGYRFDQLLRNHLPGRPVATLLTEVVVDPEDTAFDEPSRPLGPPMSEDLALRMQAERGWHVERRDGGWQRLVASPEPVDVLGMAAIRTLALANFVVVCGGGGGVPVVVDGAGRIHGIAGVVDKDLTAGLIAERLCADMLVLLTDADGVHPTAHGTMTEALRRLDAGAARALPLDPLTMGVKVEAACRFVERGHGVAVIGRPDDAAALLRGRAGTTIAPARTPAAR